MAIIFNIGLNDKETRKQEIETNKAIELIANIVGDCTIKTGAIGVYTHEDGSRVVENSLEVVSYSLDKQQARAIASELARELNQETIALSEVVQVAEFIG